MTTHAPPHPAVIEGAYFHDLLAQPDVLRRVGEKLAAAQLDNALSAGLRSGRFRRVVLTGMGSSLHASYPLHRALSNAGMASHWVETAESIEIKLGKAVTKRTTLKLPATGTVLVGCVARPSAKPGIDWKWDASLIPLTTLPYPKSASKPDYRERFGGSFAGREGMFQKYQRIGFGWTRWFPETKWQFSKRKKATTSTGTTPTSTSPRATACRSTSCFTAGRRG